MTRRADPQTTRQLVPRGQLPSFTPVPRKTNRHDGWTDERQKTFIEALADTGSVAAACRQVDMTTVGAYYLRRQPGAEEFRTAWEKAINLGVQRLEDIAMDRALNGVDVPIYSYGELIGTRKSYNDRLLMFMLRNRAPERFGNSVSGKSGRGGGDLKGMNAVGKMEKRRLKKKWREQWEEEQARAQAEARSQTSVQAVRDSIKAKIAGIREQVERERAHEWKQFSEETRAAWKAFETLRNSDFERLKADEIMRNRHYEGPREKVNGPKDSSWDERD